MSRFLVMLDDGHGNDTSGKRTPLFEDGSYMKENDFSRVVIEKVSDMFEQYENVDVFFTAKEKRDISLDERVERANDVYVAGKDLYDKIVLVSVHANALTGVWGTQNGTATFYYPNNMIDKAFAEVIQKNLIAKTKLNPHRGGVVGGNFQIIRDVKMTACLCECAFMDNLAEAKMLITDDFRQACAEGIFNGLKEYFNFNEKNVQVDYYVTPKMTHQLCGNIEDFGIKIVNKSNLSIEDAYCVNGTFYWQDVNGVTYPTSILYAEGIIYQENANHFPSPQDTFVVFRDGTIKMIRIKKLSELNLNDVRLAIGGIGLRDTMDEDFEYDPKETGFSGVYSDVLQKANKTVLGYNKKENKIYLMCRPNIYHKSLILYDLVKLVKDCEYDIAVSVDGGGSPFMNNGTEMVFKGDGRLINNIIGFGLN
ncbi:MAG: N-acetylmuramoyl-L-alanine amidase [Sedimentibacter sp.]